MNVLSYRTSDLNDLTFVLLIDDVPLHELYESDTVGVPYWLLEGQLTATTIMGETHYIVSVCDCGEPGCGSVACKVTEEDGIVTFHDFKFLANDLTLKFTAENFHQVMDEIGHEVLKFEGPQTKASTAQHNFDVMKAYLNAVEELLNKPSTRQLIEEACGTEYYGAQEAAEWICREENLAAVRDLIPIDKLKFLLLETGPTSPVILLNAYRPWTLKLIVGEGNTGLVCAGLLHEVGETVGTKEIRFLRPND